MMNMMARPSTSLSRSSCTTRGAWPRPRWSSLVQRALILAEIAACFIYLDLDDSSTSTGKLLRKQKDEGDDIIFTQVVVHDQLDALATRPALEKVKLLRTLHRRVKNRDSIATGGDGTAASAEGKQLLCALRDSVQFTCPPWEKKMKEGGATSRIRAMNATQEQPGGQDDAATTSSLTAKSRRLSFSSPEEESLPAEAQGAPDPEQEDASTFYRPPLLGKSCAIVSNSGAMLLHSYGDEIDAHDFVLRMNRAPTRGFEKHVGRRESVRAGWDSTEFLKTFCTEQQAAALLLATGRTTSGVADEHQEQTVAQAENLNCNSGSGGGEPSRETVYVPEGLIPDPECTQIMQNENNDQVQTKLATAAAARPELSEHTVASVSEQEKRRGNISCSTRPPIVPFMKTWQNVNADGDSITRFFQELYGASEADPQAKQTGGGTTSGANYGVMLLGYCDHVDLYEMSPSQAALTEQNHYYSFFGGEFHDERPSMENEPWGQGALTNSYHPWVRAEHDFFRRVAITPAEESLRTGKLRIQGLMTLTEEDCSPH
ncbi:unnamed protein product [Amoebophrya sp. A120]|nr:unnamed protein product [Amoebophrya sp. A120]|eukprot:GSA120T00015136001.1